MNAIAPTLLDKLQTLPPRCLAEVEDFVEFLAMREARAAAGIRLGETLAKLDVLNPPYYPQVFLLFINWLRICAQVAWKINGLWRNGGVFLDLGGRLNNQKLRHEGVQPGPEYRFERS